VRESVNMFPPLVPNQVLYQAEQQPAVLALNRPVPSGWCEAMERSGNGGSLALVCLSPTLIALTELSASLPDEFPMQHSLEDRFSGLSDLRERGRRALLLDFRRPTWEYRRVGHFHVNPDGCRG